MRRAPAPPRKKDTGKMRESLRVVLLLAPTTLSLCFCQIKTFKPTTASAPPRQTNLKTNYNFAYCKSTFFQPLPQPPQTTLNQPLINILAFSKTARLRSHAQHNTEGSSTKEVQGRCVPASPAPRTDAPAAARALFHALDFYEKNS